MALLSTITSVLPKSSVPGTGDSNTTLYTWLIIAGAAFLLMFTATILFFVMRRKKNNKES